MSVYTWVLSQAGGKFVGVLPHKIRVVYIYTFLIRSSLYMRTYLRLGKLYLDIILKKKKKSIVIHCLVAIYIWKPFIQRLAIFWPDSPTAQITFRSQIHLHIQTTIPIINRTDGLHTSSAYSIWIPWLTRS